MRRKDRQMDKDFAYQVIDKSTYGVLSMVDGGKPYSIPLSMIRIGDYIYFHSAKQGTKIDLLASNPQVRAVFVTNNRIPHLYSQEEKEAMLENPDELSKVVSSIFTTEYESAAAEGKVEEVLDWEEKCQALKATCQKYVPDAMILFDGAMDRSLDFTAVYKFKIEAIWGKRKLFGPDRQEIKGNYKEEEKSD